HIGDLPTRLCPSPPGRISILGLAFKGRPATSDVRGSLAGAFAMEFSRRWPAAQVLGWDPVVAEAEAATLPLTPAPLAQAARAEVVLRSEERRVGKEGRGGGSRRCRTAAG